MNTKKKKKKPRRRRVRIPTRGPSGRKKRRMRLKRRTRRKTGAGKAKRAEKKKTARRGKKAGVRKATRRWRKRKVRASKKLARKSIRKGLAQKPIYALNTNFEFFYELRDLILKSSPAEKDRMVERLNKIGRIKLAIISGVFINKENLDPLITDLFIVGDDIDRRKLRALLKATEAEVGKEIKFTIMDKDEFQYRLAMFDRFIRVLLEGPHEKLINRLGI